MQFSAPLADGSPMPTITPDVPGTWQRGPARHRPVRPRRGLPGGHRSSRSTIPGGATGIRAKDGGQLAAAGDPVLPHRRYSPARLPELLAQLGYLPLTWAPAAGPGQPRRSATRPPSWPPPTPPPDGTFSWQPGYPPGLPTFWDNGSPTGLIVHGAVMAFESDHDLTMDGQAGPAVWKALLAAADTSKANTHGYTYAVASQHQPGDPDRLPQRPGHPAHPGQHRHPGRPDHGRHRARSTCAT